jgi:hypothetical protein
MRIRRNSLAPIAWANATTIVTTQPDFTDPYTIYSDLYFQRLSGDKRLTHGARYDAVDADRSGHKVIAVANSGGQTSLVEYDTYTGADRVIVEARPDVQWVSARWNPEGTRIAAQRWTVGGRHDVVILDTLGQPSATRPQPWVMEERATDAAPTWSPDGRWVLFTSDRSGVNNIYAFDVRQEPGVMFQVTNVLTGAFFPEVSPDGRYIYYAAHHADGYTIERIPFNPDGWWPLNYGRMTDSTAVVIPERSGATQPARAYSPWRSALPKFWLPYLQDDSLNGTFIGAVTAGADDVNRHEYYALVAANFDNGRIIGDIEYTFAGFGNPLLSLGASREYEILAGESSRREDNVSLRGTFLHPRWRYSAAFTAGVEGVVVRRDSTERVLDTEDKLIGVVAGAAFGNARRPAYAISPEDGFRLSLLGRRRFDLDPVFRDATYTELTGMLTGYGAVHAFGFAHHVIAARVSALHRSGLGVGPTDVGGEGDFLPVRGFEDGDRIGFEAWSASLEYRIPVAMIGRGIGLLPFFVDRIGASIFLDAGNASCTDDQTALYLACPGNEDRGEDFLLSTGLEVQANVAFLSFIPGWVRTGVAFPVRGPRSEPRLYFALGPGF